MTTADDDASLVARCRAGDGKAWAALVKRYQRLVYTVVGRTGLDDHAAADVFQTVFTRLVQHLPRLSQPDRLQAWVVTTAKREALLARRIGLRSVSTTRDGDGDGAEAEFDLPDDAPLAAGTAALLRALDLTSRPKDLVPRMQKTEGNLCGTTLRQIDALAVLQNVTPPDQPCP